MKVLLVLLVLAGCSTVTEILPSKFDAREYDLATQVRDLSYHVTCSDEKTSMKQFLELDARITTLMLYAEGIGSNQDVFRLAAQLSSVSQAAVKRYDAGNVSQAYCTTKRDIVSKMSLSIQQVIGSKSR